jgi:ribose 5-phosphate isomerase B
MIERKLTIAIGTDHAGYPFKKELIEFIGSLGHKTLDLGCDRADACDYPEIAVKVARSVSQKKSDRGILMCGTGVGMSIAANKIKGVRAGVCWNADIAKLISEHNRANIICLPARFAGLDQMKQWIKIWIETPYSDEARHIRRLEQVKSIEGSREK